jgi:hypothetical protein
MSSIKENTEAIAAQVVEKANQVQLSTESSQAYQEITSNIITLMGLSFMLGVFFTTFLLLILEFVRRNRGEQ